MAQRTAQLQLEHRRTIRWTLAIVAMLVLKAVGLRMPKPVLLFAARAPVQYRVPGGRWQTYRLDPAELQRRFA